MTRSIWRLSHLLLALVASLFLLLAAITGAILSLEPIQAKSKANFKQEWEHVSLQQTIDSLQTKYLEITSIEKDEHGFFNTDVMTDDGDFIAFQLNPTTGEKAGEKYAKSSFFEWMTTLHRSLFLDQTGRFIVGLSSLLLFLIAISGMVLIIQRTKSWKALVNKVEKSFKAQFYHVVLGRLAFLPIIILSLTATYLFLQRFHILPKETTKELVVDIENKNEKAPKIDFKQLQLGEITKVEFPLSPDEEDYFVIYTPTHQYAVDQYDNTILAEVEIPSSQQWAAFTLHWHTGRGTFLWAALMGVAASSILYFIYSGFSMTLKSREGRTKNSFNLEESSILILYGSESGNTRNYAKLLLKQLIEQGTKAHLAEMNAYRPSESIKQLIVLTSTHGVGEAPANATKFIEKWKKQPLTHDFQFSVIGFGSLAYTDFCAFAEKIDQLLASYNNASQATSLVKIHNQSYHSFKSWSQDWQLITKIPLTLPSSVENKKLPLLSFEVVSKNSYCQGDEETIVLILKPLTNHRFQSGDLLAVYPPQDPYERYYSIAQDEKGQCLITVKKHAFGICSNYLINLGEGTVLEAGIKHNSDFHYNPKKEAVFISNGTGIGPFLGMATTNKQHKTVHLYWGGRTQQSFSLYESILEKQLKEQQISTVNLAFSREETQAKKHVYMLIERDQEQLIQLLKKGAIVYICGSLAMQENVIEVLDRACKTHLNKSFSYFQQKGQVKTDCY
jgi:sulfite reductase (NADPH) flavoprotein alpha-component